MNKKADSKFHYDRTTKYCQRKCILVEIKTEETCSLLKRYSARNNTGHRPICSIQWFYISAICIHMLRSVPYNWKKSQMHVKTTANEHQDKQALTPLSPQTCRKKKKRETLKVAHFMASICKVWNRIYWQPKQWFLIEQLLGGLFYSVLTLSFLSSNTEAFIDLVERGFLRVHSVQGDSSPLHSDCGLAHQRRHLHWCCCQTHIVQF